MPAQTNNPPAASDATDGGGPPKSKLLLVGHIGHRQQKLFSAGQIGARVSNEWISTLPTDLATVSATGVASGAISAARYLYFANSQPVRLPLLLRCFNAVLVGASGVVIGSMLAALLYHPDYPLRTFGAAGTLSICVDPMNLTATRTFLVRFVRALAMLPRQLQLDGERGQQPNSRETSGSQVGLSSSSEDQPSERAP